MRRPLAGVITLLLLAGLIWAGRGRRASEEGGPAEPASWVGTDIPAPPSPVVPPPTHPAEARIQSLLESARGADVPGYLDAFGGSLRAKLDREVAERGRDRFAADLAAASRSRKSHAVFAAEPDGAGAARVVVETVYPDRNERQTYRVERRDDAWKVVEVETIRSHQPRAKFGTPASFEAPEGVPVQGSGLRVETGENDPAAPAPR
ncbi:MAG: hypothetical protein U0794_09420 [Isosphaeraceae bacterium]